MKNIHALIERFLLSPVYFILFSIYPVLQMYAHNVHGVLLADLFRPLIISLFCALLLFGIAQLWSRHSQTSALIVFSIFLSFFYYGHVRNLLNNSHIYVQDKNLAAVWLFIIFLSLAWIARNARGWNTKTFAVSLNLMTIILLLFPTIKLAVYTVARATPLKRKTDNTIHVDMNVASPDIYYIILDGYARSDVMKERFGYDNSAFIHSLRDLGFYVADCSNSNYGSTSLAVSSTLNMDYLQNVSVSFDEPENSDLLYAFKALESNTLRKTLSSVGYQTVAFASGFTWIEWRDADHFLSPEEKGVSEFEVSVLFSSYARILDDLGFVNLDDIYAEHYRQRTRLILDDFDELLNLPSPKFVFIHVIAPHEPYGLDENGNNVNPDQVDSMTGYRNQAKFIGNAILPRLQKLINESSNPPVIILQGDHGSVESHSINHMKILNAYYLPGHTNQLYTSISPVNTFRVVLNSYFGTNFPLLDDISYYSSNSSYYDFSVTSDACSNLVNKVDEPEVANGFDVVR